MAHEMFMAYGFCAKTEDVGPMKADMHNTSTLITRDFEKLATKNFDNILFTETFVRPLNKTYS